MPKLHINAIQLLKSDHRAVEDLFHQYEKCTARAKKTREVIVRKVIQALSVHLVIEETTFYPAVRSRIQSAEATVLEALEEHHVVKWTLSELDDMSADDERFDAKMKVLMEVVRHHFEEEERELLPEVRGIFSLEELADIGDALRAAKLSASKRPHPRRLDHPPTTLMEAAMTAPVDTARLVGEAAVRKIRDFAHN